MPTYIVNAGTPSGKAGERRGVIKARSEKAAREAYLSNPAHQGWVIFDISKAVKE